MAIVAPGIVGVGQSRRLLRAAQLACKGAGQDRPGRCQPFRRMFLPLLYGTGLRLFEGLRLRVKDIDFSINQITVRDGKGGKDRVTMLPSSLKASCRDS